jgi:hypothetical protein
MTFTWVNPKYMGAGGESTHGDYYHLAQEQAIVNNKKP